ncbi:hypothetical protein [Sphingopyxis sp. GW247-27LB]|uniref:hypothetical protein n=1 Tax=Sphingopyxis sp. GW247-27LB TaxID=2012632 RepID=UPI001140B663|nr:hypothetical protein [Sphingopyxis sp. GW247-27LB]
MSDVARLRYATNRPIGDDGLNDNERRVLDLWDAYVPAAKIVDQTGLSREFVSQVLSEFSVTALEPWKVDAAQGSAALVAALTARFPHRCGAAS